MTLGTQHFFDNMRCYDGHTHCFNVHLFSALLRILVMAHRYGLVLLHMNGDLKHFSAQVSRRICMGLSWISISYCSLSKNKRFLLFRTCWWSFARCAWVLNSWIQMDVLLWLSHFFHVGFTYDCIMITLFNWYDFWACFCSLLLHTRFTLSRLCWLLNL